MTTLSSEVDLEQGGMSQTDVVVYRIKKMILDGELAPGDKLPIEKDLAPRLGVSRSSLREGVRALSIMGVLETRQGAGMFVTALDASLLLAPMGFVVDLQQPSGCSARPLGPTCAGDGCRRPGCDENLRRRPRRRQPNPRRRRGGHRERRPRARSSMPT